MRWFRFYDDVVNDPKVQRLPAELFRTWVNLLCIASANDGDLPAISDIAFTLRLPEAKLRQQLSALIGAGLLDESPTLHPHNWAGRQYTSEQKQQWRHRDKREEAGLPRNRWVNPKVRQAVFERDGNACVHCGDAHNLTIDHIVPEMAGGSNEPSNLQTLCRACNARKREFPDEVARKSATHKAPHKGHITTDTDTDTDTDTEQRQKEPPDPIGSAPPRKPDAKGTRIEADWQPDPDDAAFAGGLGLNASAVAAQFLDHWLAKPGAAGRKLDWSATWRNWCRREAAGGFGDGGRGRVQRGPASIAAATAAVIEAAARAGKPAGRDWHGGAGSGPVPQPHGQPAAGFNGSETDDWGFIGGTGRVPAGRRSDGPEKVAPVIEVVADAGGDTRGMPMARGAQTGNAEPDEEVG